MKRSSEMKELIKIEEAREIKHSSTTSLVCSTVFQKSEFRTWRLYPFYIWYSWDSDHYNVPITNALWLKESKVERNGVKPSSNKCSKNAQILIPSEFDYIIGELSNQISTL